MTNDELTAENQRLRQALDASAQDYSKLQSAYVGACDRIAQLLAQAPATFCG